MDHTQIGGVCLDISLPQEKLLSAKVDVEAIHRDKDVVLYKWRIKSVAIGRSIEVAIKFFHGKQQRVFALRSSVKKSFRGITRRITGGRKGLNWPCV
jgi:hypothetical protein